MTDLQTLKATAKATAEKCPELLVTVPAGVMVELIRDVERYRWITENADVDCRGHVPDGEYGSLCERIDVAMSKEAQ